MKKQFYIPKIGLIAYWALLPWCLSAQTQGSFTGTWEGNFMKDFKTVILLDCQDEKSYAGKIIMFSGETRIQDDELSSIIIERGSLSFYIAAKETAFKGTFNAENTELSGHFIFPDQSKHPLTVTRVLNSEASDATGTVTKGPDRRLIPVDQLKSDVKHLVNKLKEYHPRLYSYTSESAFEGRVEDVMSELNRDMTVEQFYMRIAPIVESAKCSHTGIRLPGEYMQALSGACHFFPLRLYISDHRAFYLSAPGIPVDIIPGCEITAINSTPVKEIIDQLLCIIPSEGNCITTKYQELNRDFPYYYYLLDQSDRYDIGFIASSETGNLQLDAVSYQETVDMVVAPIQSYDFHMEGDPGYGVLTLASFGIMDMEGYFTFLDSAFQLLGESGVQSLLLDLRGNTGGHPIFAAQLFSYLTNKDFTYFKRNPQVTDFEPLYNPMQPNRHHFDGDIYVLVNGTCQSTTGHLISLLKYHTSAIFIGEEPGSTFTCNDFSIQFRLPNTGLEVNVPRATFVTDVEGFSEKEPFPLDYRVEVSVEDVLSGNDNYMTAAVAIINENSTQP